MVSDLYERLKTIMKEKSRKENGSTNYPSLIISLRLSVIIKSFD